MNIELSPNQMASILGISRGTLLNRIKENKVSFKEDTTDGRYLFNIDDIQENIRTLYDKGCSIISVANRKGGVGKTFFAINLARTLNLLGFKVLIVDADEQGDCSEFFIGETDESLASIYNVFMEDNPIGVISRTKYQDLHILPATLRLEDINDNKQLDTYIKLKDFLNSIKRDYDFIIIDNPPQVSTTMEAALIASDYVIAVAVPKKWSVNGINRLMKIINRINRSINQNNPSKLDILGCVLNSIDLRRILDRDFIEFGANALGNVKVFKTHIPDTTKYAQTVSLNQPIHDAKDAKLDPKTHIEPFYKVTMEILNELKR